MSISSQELGDLLEKSGQPRIGAKVHAPDEKCTGEWRQAVGALKPVVVAKRSKYSAVRSVDAAGRKWDSKAEERRWKELRMRETIHDIYGLQRQVRFDITIKGIFCGYYKADFVYSLRTGEKIVEDVKGVKTSTYRLKKKLVEAQYGVTITEIS